MIIAQIHHFFNKGFVFLEPQFGHIFKKELGISLHQYITQKRLLYARKLIKEANYPTKIYTEIGFKEYTSFYNSYKNFFGYPPSYEKQKNITLIRKMNERLYFISPLPPAYSQ